MDDVRGKFLGPPYGTTPDAVIAYEIYRFDAFEAVREIVLTISRNFE